MCTQTVRFGLEYKWYKCCPELSFCSNFLNIGITITQVFDHHKTCFSVFIKSVFQGLLGRFCIFMEIFCFISHISLTNVKTVLVEHLYKSKYIPAKVKLQMWSQHDIPNLFLIWQQHEDQDNLGLRAFPSVKILLPFSPWCPDSLSIAIQPLFPNWL